MRQSISTIFLITLLWFTAACRQEVVPSPVPVATVPGNAPAPVGTPIVTDQVERVDTPTAVSVSPTPTPPLAALINDQPLLLSTYEKELARYEQAQIELGLTPDADRAEYGMVVLNALIEQTLIEQAAVELDIVVTPDQVEQKLIELQSLTGGSENFAAWLQANQWTEEEFRQALLTEMITERLVNHVTADVPYAVEQVRARYLQVDNAALAQSLLEQIRGGATFALLAQTHSLDRVTGQNGGDLGYFSPGSLLVPEVEAAAFALPVDEVSEVIPVTGNGGLTTYYLVQVIERDPQRPLSADARYALLQETFEAWLAQLWDQAAIVRFVDTDA